MTIYFVCAPMGSGKTLTMTMLGYVFYSMGVKIFSNYRISYPHTPIMRPEQIEDIAEGVFLGDELWKWLDSRASAQKKNAFYTTILLKSRKKKFHIFHSAQFKSQPDKRLREHTDYFIFPEFDKYSKTCTIKLHEYLGHDYIESEPAASTIFNAAPFYDMYNTSAGLYEDEAAEKIKKMKKD
jgi:hypothetical protein